MKFINSYKISIFCFLLIFSLLSCTTENLDNRFLEEAQEIVESNPEDALRLLDSISLPEKMDTEDYMKYVVIQFQAKYTLKKDVSNDTLIFAAQKYFENRNNYAFSALANYCISVIYYQKQEAYQELKYSQLALYDAKKVNDNLLVAKSLHSIGTIYYDKMQYDSAIAYYNRAIEYYKIDGSMKGQELTLEAIRMKGLSYASIDIKKEVECFDEGYQKAKVLDNQRYITTFEHLKGLGLYKQKDYVTASYYLKKALAETKNPEEKTRVYLIIARLYNDIQQMDSAVLYNIKLKESIPLMTYPYTIRDAYRVLSDFYKMKGDYDEAFRYADLYRRKSVEISESNSSRALTDAEQEYKDILKNKEERVEKIFDRMLIISCTIIGILTLIMAYTKQRNMRQSAIARNKLLGTKLKLQKIEIESHNKIMAQQSQTLSFTQNIYSNIITEWAKIDKQVKTLAKQYGTTKEPELYIQIKNLIETFKQKTNEHLVSLAKDYLRDKPFGEKVIAVLEDKELLLFMLYYNGYKRNEVSLFLGVHPHRNNMLLRKMDLKNKLLKTGMPEEDITNTLFAEDQ